MFKANFSERVYGHIYYLLLNRKCNWYTPASQGWKFVKVLSKLWVATLVCNLKLDYSSDKWVYILEIFKIFNSWQSLDKIAFQWQNQTLFDKIHQVILWSPWTKNLIQLFLLVTSPKKYKSWITRDIHIWNYKSISLIYTTDFTIIARKNYIRSWKNSHNFVSFPFFSK